MSESATLGKHSRDASWMAQSTLKKHKKWIIHQFWKKFLENFRHFFLIIYHLLSFWVFRKNLRIQTLETPPVAPAMIPGRDLAAKIRCLHDRKVPCLYFIQFIQFIHNISDLTTWPFPDSPKKENSHDLRLRLFYCKMEHFGNNSS